MKATQACKIVGYALEDADHEGTIQVFANHGVNATPEAAALRAQVKDLKQQNTSLDARLTAMEQALESLLGSQQDEAPAITRAAMLSLRR